MASGHVNRFGTFRTFPEHARKLPLNTCPCLPFVAPDALAVTAFPTLSRRWCGFAVD